MQTVFKVDERLILFLLVFQSRFLMSLLRQLLFSLFRVSFCHILVVQVATLQDILMQNSWDGEVLQRKRSVHSDVTSMYRTTLTLNQHTFCWRKRPYLLLWKRPSPPDCRAFAGRVYPILRDCRPCFLTQCLDEADQCYLELGLGLNNSCLP